MNIIEFYRTMEFVFKHWKKSRGKLGFHSHLFASIRKPRRCLAHRRVSTSRRYIFLALEPREREGRDVAAVVVPRPFPKGKIATCPGENMTRPSHSVVLSRPVSLSSLPHLHLSLFLPSRDSVRPEGMKIPRTSPVERQCQPTRETVVRSKLGSSLSPLSLSSSSLCLFLTISAWICAIWLFNTREYGFCFYYNDKCARQRGTQIKRLSGISLKDSTALKQRQVFGKWYKRRQMAVSDRVLPITVSSGCTVPIGSF